MALHPNKPRRIVLRPAPDLSEAIDVCAARGRKAAPAFIFETLQASPAIREELATIQRRQATKKAAA